MAYLPPMADLTILNRDEKIYTPKQADLNNSTLDFEIKNEEFNSVIDLQGVEFMMDIEISKADGTMLTMNEVAAVPSINFPHCLWKNIKVVCGGKIVSSQDSRYPIRAFLKKMEKMTKGQQELNFTSDFFAIEEDLTAGENTYTSKPATEIHKLTLKKESFPAADTDDDWPEATEMTAHPETFDNIAARMVREFTRHRGTSDRELGRRHIFQDKIYECPFTTPHYLPSNVGLKVTFERNSHGYCLKGDNADNYRILIKDVHLIIPYLELSAEKFAEINQRIASLKRPLDLWFERDVITTKEITPLINNYTFKNIFEGQTTDILPERLMFGFVTDNILNGDKKTNNFHFMHYNLTKFTIIMPNRVILGKPEKPKYDFSAGLTEQAYKEFRQLIDVNYDGLGSPVSEDIYTDYLSLFGHRFTAQPLDIHKTQATAIGDWKLTCEWEKPPAADSGLMLMCIGRFKSSVKIQPNFAVTTDYN